MMFLFVTFYSHTNPWDITKINKKNLNFNRKAVLWEKEEKQN